jgi:hypothetical protein
MIFLHFRAISHRATERAIHQTRRAIPQTQRAIHQKGIAPWTEFQVKTLHGR